MRKIRLVAVALIASAVMFAGKGRSQDFLSGLVKGQYAPKTPAAIQSMQDGESYTQLSADGKTITKYSYKSGKEVAVLFDASKTLGKKVEKIDGYFWGPKEKMMLIYTNAEKTGRHSFKADYYTFDVQRNKLLALSDSVGKQRDPIFSPNGLNVVFVRGNDICLKKIPYNSESRVTTSGANPMIFNGFADWMYEEEFAVTNLIAWSPDSKRIAYVSLDESEVGTYSYTVFGGYPFQSEADLYPTMNSIKYPKTGTKLPKASIHVFDVYYKKPMDVEFPEKGELYIPGIKWSNELEQFMVFSLNRNQDLLRMYSVNSKSLIAELLLEDKGDPYVDYRNINAVQFQNDGKFTFMSEKDGYRHLYLYKGNGLLDKQLTSGNFDVTEFYGYDTIKGMYYYQAAEASPLVRDVYSMDAKGKVAKLTEGGVNNASFNLAYTYFMNETSSLNVPTKYLLYSANGKMVREVEENKDLAEQVAALPQKEFITVQGAAGDSLNAWVLKPADFSESKKYPVVMYQYSGPDYQEVLDAYSVGLEQNLAANGFIVVCVDARGSGARGEKFRKSTYMHLGEKEAQDMTAVAKYFNSQSYVAKGKIGIWGWSYGGYATLMAMSTGNAFAAGVAVAPVTDWKYYDAAYTERYMRRPEENINGYDRSSPMALASKLSGRLLLIHGTADENTHIQNTYNYAEQLTLANKQFDMQIYPNQKHALNGGNTRFHMFTRITEFFEDQLK